MHLSQWSSCIEGTGVEDRNHHGISDNSRLTECLCAKRGSISCTSFSCTRGEHNYEPHLEVKKLRQAKVRNFQVHTAIKIKNEIAALIPTLACAS